jgi:hypothetical protein
VALKRERDALRMTLDAAIGLAETLGHPAGCASLLAAQETLCFCMGEECRCLEMIEATCDCGVKAMRDLLGGVK